MAEGQDFWSRRRAAAAEEEAREAARHEAALLAEEHQKLEEKTDEEILAELDLPDPDTLAPGDSVQAFMSRAVPDRIRRRALRKLWSLNPALANLDGLVDYGEDFTDAATVVANLQTTYQVGKGMLAHVQAMARKAEEAAQAAEDAEAADTDADSDATPEAGDPGALAAAPEGSGDGTDGANADTPDGDAAGQSVHAADASTTMVVTDSASTDLLELDMPSPAPRRMTFRFETEST